MSARIGPRWLPKLISLGLFLTTMALYLPTLRNDFVQYDDQQYVTENSIVRGGLSAKSLVWAFGFHAGNWHPLAWISHLLDCQIFGMNPAGHHLTSILFHAGTTVLLFLVLHRMTRAPWRSAAVAALFAWHPLHVESVAWIAERKDVLCAFFWMLTLGAYVRYAEKSTIGRYLVTLASFALCLMAKPMGVTLPFVLLLLDYWPLNRIAKSKLANPSPTKSAETVPAWPAKRLLLEKVPFLVMATGACALTIAAQREAIVSTGGLPVAQRIFHALAAYGHYLGAAFLPIKLAVYYPYELVIPNGIIAMAGVVIVGISFLALIWAKRRPYLAVGWLWYLGTLVPVIGLVQVGDQAWADRYTYIPLIGVMIAVVWGAFEIIRRRELLVGIAAVVGSLLMTTTVVQESHWKNTSTLFTHTYAVTRENYMALTLIGSQLAQEDKLDEAIEDYRTALRFKPGFPEAYFFLANALEKQGKTGEAQADYEKALRYKPISEQTHIFLGMLLGKQSKYPEAEAHYRAAIKLNADSPVAHNNLARLLQTQGKLDEAAEHYQTALALNPALALAENNLGILLIQQGKLAEGINHLRKALQLKPGDVESQYNLAQALNQDGKWGEAAGLFERTATSASHDPKAHYEYAKALYHLNKIHEALSQYASALLLQPDFPEALDGLSWILATNPNPQFRNGTEAVKMSKRACELTGEKQPDDLMTLAAAHAEIGEFGEAIAAIQKARVLASQANRKDLIQKCGLMTEPFQASKPWREPASP